MALSAAILLPIMCIRRKGTKEAPIVSLRRMTVKQWLWSVLASAFLALHYLTWMTSLDATSTFASVALVCTQPLFVAALSGIVLKEKMPRAARPGAIVAVIGALLIAAEGLGSQNVGDLKGALLALAGPKRITVRVPRIPGFNTDADVEASVAELKGMGVEELDLFSYKIPNKKLC